MSKPTEFVLVDADGRSRDYFSTREDAITALTGEEANRPGLTTRWMLLAYDNDGEVGEPEWASQLLGADGSREEVAPAQSPHFVGNQIPKRVALRGRRPKGKHPVVPGFAVNKETPLVGMARLKGEWVKVYSDRRIHGNKKVLVGSSFSHKARRND